MEARKAKKAIRMDFSGHGLLEFMYVPLNQRDPNEVIKHAAGWADRQGFGSELAFLAKEHGTPPPTHDERKILAAVAAHTTAQAILSYDARRHPSPRKHLENKVAAPLVKLLTRLSERRRMEWMQLARNLAHELRTTPAGQRETIVHESIGRMLDHPLFEEDLIREAREIGLEPNTSSIRQLRAIVRHDLASRVMASAAKGTLAQGGVLKDYLNALESAAMRLAKNRRGD